MRWLFLFLCLSACGAASPHFRDAPATRVYVDHTVFEVRHKGRLAEATRLNSQFAPNLRSVAPYAETAIRAATGCDVRELRGDAAQIIGILDCQNQTAEPWIFSNRRSAECEVVDVFVPSGGVTGYLEADCG